MDQTTIATLDRASDEELEREELRLLAQSSLMLEQGLALLTEAERFRGGAEANPGKFQQLCADYLQLHQQHMLLHADFVRVHDERQRRRHERRSSPYDPS